MSFCFPCYPFIYCVCRGSVRGRFFRILAPTAQHCGGWLFICFYRLAQLLNAF
ncbi:MAG: hypothetical protein MR658_08135 [Campylobacter sp.]|uniref:hypothetical protein n=1 Tax=Campylobacter sp. TaxID=205 RepID=UPI002AA95F8D|nr:hypothetical protein [Campylobacter sp.]MCI6178777.1 hypothetical protein [Campylobacter sp.]